MARSNITFIGKAIDLDEHNGLRYYSPTMALEIFDRVKNRVKNTLGFEVPLKTHELAYSKGAGLSRMFLHVDVDTYDINTSLEEILKSIDPLSRRYNFEPRKDFSSLSRVLSALNKAEINNVSEVIVYFFDLVKQGKMPNLSEVHLNLADGFFGIGYNSNQVRWLKENKGVIVIQNAK